MFCVATISCPPLTIPAVETDVTASLYVSRVGSPIAVCNLLISVNGIPSRL